MATIRLSNLHKSFGDFTAVRDTTLDLEDGRFVVLLGPSGCGKTTTLRMIAGLEYPNSGKIELDGVDVTYRRPRERDIAMVFQLFALYGHMNVRENLEFPLKNERVPKVEIERRIQEAARMLRIESFLDARISKLSGGDRQRVALGRAIVRQPKAFLMDEPLGTLDAEFREVMCVELRRLHQRLRTTTVFVTHDQNEAMALADQVVVMNQGDVLQADTPDAVYNYPATMFVAGFIGRPSMNFVPVDGGVAIGQAQVAVPGATIAVPRSAAVAQGAVLGVRPEHIDFDAAAAWRGKVTQAEYFGAHWIVTVETAAANVKVLAHKGACPAVGDNVGLRPRTERVVLFDCTTERLLPSQRLTAVAKEVAYG
ncbi:MAG TPA: ABC transporter ATP-binding protein [Burkholderiaceae bacterium]|nr:ABC transporter ATP-binding protein [Burkholderiaceae bacterium]